MIANNQLGCIACMTIARLSDLRCVANTCAALWPCPFQNLWISKLQCNLHIIAMKCKTDIFNSIMSHELIPSQVSVYITSFSNTSQAILTCDCNAHSTVQLIVRVDSPY